MSEDKNRKLPVGINDYESYLDATGGSDDAASDSERDDASYREDFVRRSSFFYTGSDGQTRFAEMDQDEPGADASGAGRRREFRRDSSADGERVEPAASGVAQAAGGDREQGPSAARLYAEAVNRWENARYGEMGEDGDGYVIEETREQRIKFAERLMENGGLADPALRGLEAYVSADLAYLNRPDPSEGDYAQFVERRSDLRDQVFGPNAAVGPENYVLATQLIQNMVESRSNIQDQYDLIEIRREAALEHFDDPRFIARVGMHEGRLLDEMLVDFDRSDLRSEIGIARSDALASSFSGFVSNRPAADAPVADKVSSFMEMRQAGVEIRHNQRAIIGFAKSAGEDTVNYELGMSALDNKTYSADVMEEFIQKGGLRERLATISASRHATELFSLARKRFEEEFDAGNPRAATSFAVMEKVSRQIIGNEGLVQKLSAKSLDDASALFAFRDKNVDARSEKVSAKISDEVDATMAANQALNTSGDKHVVLKGNGKDKSGAEFEVDLRGGAAAHMSIVDGGRVLLAKSKEDFEAGRFVEARIDGIAAPKLGQQTKNGKLDAGEEAKAHLETLVSRYGESKISMEVMEGKDGVKAVRMVLPTGEDLSARMIRDGYAAPMADGDGAIRNEWIAKQAQANKRGLWKAGFADVDESWRSESEGPGLSRADKKQKLNQTVAMSMSGSPSDITRKLGSKETQLFALPIEKWSGSGAVAREVMKIARSNPGRLASIYENNMEILRDLRKRKDELTPAEKLAHDRLSIGRRAMGEALVETGHMNEAQSRKDGHPLMSRKAFQLDPKYREKVAETAARVGEGAAEVTKSGVRGVGTLLKTAIDFADERGR